MGLGERFYLFADEGLQRISQRLMDGLAHSKDVMPQFAGTRQKVAIPCCRYKSFPAWAQIFPVNSVREFPQKCLQCSGFLV
jgi:hypothetical protein